MELMAKIGEVIVYEGCVVIFFMVLAVILSVKIGLLIKILKFAGILLACMCVGVFLGSLFSETVGSVGGLLGLVIGAILGFSSVASS